MKTELRHLHIHDLPRFVELANNQKISANMTDEFPHPFTLEKGKAFFTRVTAQDPPHVLGVTCDGQLSGAIGVHPQSGVYRKNAELGYWLGEPFWGRGVMTRAVKLMIDYAFENFDIQRIYARPYGPNIASQRVLEKAGFLLEAKLHKTILKKDEYLDEFIYAIRRKAG